MKALVLTDYWKYNLSKGDHVSDADYSPKILRRAEKTGYVVIIDESEAPTMDSLKSEIKEYLDSKGIEYTSSMTKSELLDQI